MFSKYCVISLTVRPVQVVLFMLLLLISLDDFNSSFLLLSDICGDVLIRFFVSFSISYKLLSFKMLKERLLSENGIFK